MQYLFWISFSIIIYTYLGYPVLLYLLVRIKRLVRTTTPPTNAELLPITVLIACYNEEDILEDKIINTLSLDYPAGKRAIWFVTDGSTDRSAEILRKYPEITHFHSPERKGKNAAINRVMPYVETPVVVLSDANTSLNKESLINIARHYSNPQVGAVAGEKKIMVATKDGAASSGEGFYWKYESTLKRWDSELNTVVGAAGELFSIRSELYEEIPAGVIIEDFRLSMNIAAKGYKVVYEPDAFAMETGSASIEEERKRKIRISAGGLIEVRHFIRLFNFFRYGTLGFQFVSHRALRWTFAPICLFTALVSNVFLAFRGNAFFIATLAFQCVFYLFALTGSRMKSKPISLKIFFIPYYFVFMNISVFQGLIRLISGKQSAVWEKAKRQSNPERTLENLKLN